ncbi:hypothetical protein SMICM17S_06260 [Streptomyces microflavus]
MIGATERSVKGRVLEAQVEPGGGRWRARPAPGNGAEDQRPVGGGGVAGPLDVAFWEPEDDGAPWGGGVVLGGVDCHPSPWPDAAFAPDPPGPWLPPTWPLVSSDTLVGAG